MRAGKLKQFIYQTLVENPGLTIDGLTTFVEKSPSAQAKPYKNPTVLRTTTYSSVRSLMDDQCVICNKENRPHTYTVNPDVPFEASQPKPKKEKKVKVTVDPLDETGAESVETGDVADPLAE